MQLEGGTWLTSCRSQVWVRPTCLFVDSSEARAAVRGTHPLSLSSCALPLPCPYGSSPVHPEFSRNTSSYTRDGPIHSNSGRSDHPQPVPKRPADAGFPGGQRGRDPLRGLNREGSHRGRTPRRRAALATAVRPADRRPPWPRRAAAPPPPPCPARAATPHTRAAPRPG